jgi:hypothetical protein
MTVEEIKKTREEVDHVAQPLTLALLVWLMEHPQRHVGAEQYSDHVSA